MKKPILIILIILIIIALAIAVYFGYVYFKKRKVPLTGQELNQVIESFDPEKNESFESIENIIDKNGKKAIPEIVKKVEDEDLYARYMAVYILSRVGNNSVIPELEKMLDDDNLSIRNYAAGASAYLGSKNEKVRSVLVEGLESEELLLFSESPKKTKDNSALVLKTYYQDWWEDNQDKVGWNINLPISEAQAKTTAAVNDDQCLIDFTTYIEYYGPGVSKKIAQEWSQAIEDIWNQADLKYNCYDFYFNVEYITSKNGGTRSDYHQIKIANAVKLKNGQMNRSYVQGSGGIGGDGEWSRKEQGYMADTAEGIWYVYKDSQENQRTAAHEAGHLWGLDDDYTEIDTSGDGKKDKCVLKEGANPDSIMDDENGNPLPEHANYLASKLGVDTTIDIFQGSIKGQVLDAEGGIPLGNGFVKIKSSSGEDFWEIKTDADGYYERNIMDCEIYELTAVKECYQSQKTTVILGPCDKTDARQDFKLTEMEDNKEQCQGFTIDETITIPELTTTIDAQAEVCENDDTWTGTWHQEGQPPATAGIMQAAGVVTDTEFFFTLPEKSGWIEKSGVTKGTYKGGFAGQTFAEVRIDCVEDDYEIIMSSELEALGEMMEEEKKKTVERARELCKGNFTGGAYYNAEEKTITFYNKDPDFSFVANITNYEKECGE